MFGTAIREPKALALPPEVFCTTFGEICRKSSTAFPHAIPHTTASRFPATNVHRRLAAPATPRSVQETFLIGSATRKVLFAFLAVIGLGLDGGQPHI